LLLALVIVIFQLGEPSASDRPVRAVALEPPKVEPPPARVAATAEATPSRSARGEASPAKPSDAARLTTRLTDERYEPEAPAARAVSPRQAVSSGIPSSEPAEEVESILALLLEGDDPDARDEGVYRLSELDPREVGPELVRQLNARRMGTRRDPRLRDAWQRAREVLCDGAARDPEAGPPPIVLGCG
jgi:hypothetical protein